MPSYFQNLNKLNQFFLYSLTCFLLFECTPKLITIKKPNKKDILSCFSWNEDSRLSYNFYIYNDFTFKYTHVIHFGFGRIYEYEGTFTYAPNKDTLFLKFDNNIKPLNLKNYLIFDSTFNKIRQDFDNDSKPIIMKKYNRCKD
jgi:hypothetical protein